jgi:PPOX class probable F420-dependent enzyme
LNQLSERARELLQGRHFAVLATVNADGTIHQSVMWYLLGGDTILMNTMLGRVKERNMRRNPHVSLCVQRGYQYVTIRGKVEFIDDSGIAQYDIYRLALRYDGQESAFRQMEERFSKEHRVTLHLKPERVTEYFSM